MKVENKVKGSVYQKIALDIASRIVEKNLKIGEKIYSRSSISSQYKVSPETARRAINILSDLDIVETMKGSGVIIKSYENAVKYVRGFSDKQTIKALINEINESFNNQKKEIEILKKNFDLLTENTQRFHASNPFVPFEIKITKDSKHLNKSASEINFWQNTNATIVAIKRNNSIILSPGAYALFLEDDIFYFVGDDNSYLRVKEFMYSE
ncbi:GntR family transcriptional regulator [Sedimentibacter hydroxybenzoicus DSM 7310]|uniref:GntR family transcriptional regulator n=1 Tax=Sedimentibacter hydroxybenzoicus DSM 7310 TaxID=1123245 RepID=A0A974GXZ4_SEDHY|nr:TrkA C-terminal domain-containing protein [Sedimentibacter hydroxybenzoicus]NYB76132.1 GntR family transcriptional regulator [Sedimentibacter hydroxybenzoicus DSM 7310]